MRLFCAFRIIFVERPLTARRGVTDGVHVNGANVVKTDIETSNGVIHVIDGVMMPKL